MLASFSQPPDEAPEYGVGASAEIRDEINVVSPMAKRNRFLCTGMFSSDKGYNQRVLMGL